MEKTIITNQRTIGLRREDKNKWEKRTPLIPLDLKKLKEKYNINSIVQPSPIRIYKDEEYKNEEIEVGENLSKCAIVFSVKEIPIHFIKQNQIYLFFSHTIKGQPYNMPMLQKLMEKKCTLIDYERIVTDEGKRIIFFGKYAGLAGMIDTLWALGKRLDWEGIENPFSHIKQTYFYPDLEHAKEHIRQCGKYIRSKSVRDSIFPFICGFAGYGNVSQGAQEIYDLLPMEEIKPSDLGSDKLKHLFSKQKAYKVVFKEEDLVELSDRYSSFELNDYYTNPQKYTSKTHNYLPYLTVLMNAIYWDSRYPMIVTKEYLKNKYAKKSTFPLRVIGDISCDINGAIECTTKSTSPDNPVFVYNPLTDTIADGVAGQGIVIMAIDNLPCELPMESSKDFSAKLMPFIPEIVQADYTGDFNAYLLPEPIKKAVIVYKGELTPDYAFMKKYL